MSEQSATIVWLDPVERLGEIERERIAEGLWFVRRSRWHVAVVSRLGSRLG